MSEQVVRLEHVNNRPPAVVFGLSWDFALHDEEKEPTPSLLSRGLHRLMALVRHKPDLDEAGFMKQAVMLPPHEQEAAKTLWARREQLSNLDAKALVLAGGRVIARLTPLTPEVLEGAVTNTGDDSTGSGGGDDELVTVNLNVLPDHADAVVLYVESNQKRALSRYLNPACHVSYMRGGAPLLKRTLANIGASGFVIGVLHRRADGFYFDPMQAGYDAADPDALQALVRMPG